MIQEALKKLSKLVVKEDVSWDDNDYTPKHYTHGDRKRYFTNYNKELVDRISEIKAKQ